jgi:molybdopterin-synthase adenylyltransferase
MFAALAVPVTLDQGQQAWHLMKGTTMQHTIRHLIRFKQGDLAIVREELLANRSREHFAVLLGKTQQINGHTVITVRDILFSQQGDYDEQSLASLQIKKDFIHRVLVELTGRQDVDTLIDVHTHPFVGGAVSFSAIDNRDETTFCRFLQQTFTGIYYASIVFSQTQYAARIWVMQGGAPVAKKALLKTQTSREGIVSADHPPVSPTRRKGVGNLEDLFQRSTLALGLDVMRAITQEQVIVLVGVGGLGSIIAEHLIHMGFQEIHLIDPDVLEISNLNRIVGAYYEDAQQQRPKVEVVRRHLTRINPAATVHAWRNDVHDPAMEEVLALSDWIIVATDNHSSRLAVQRLSVKYFVPLLSVGVNITVEGQEVKDRSGEVILARVGDGLCLQCLGRINPIKVASERHPDPLIREELVKRGYVQGMEVKEPAVKTLNAMVATLAVETLVNEYTGRDPQVPILVYEQNGASCIYEDSVSVEARHKQCFLCQI